MGSAQAALPKQWLTSTDLYGNHLYRRLTLTLDGTNLKGTFDGDPLQGTLEKGRIHFLARDPQNTLYDLQGSLREERMTGVLSVTRSTDLNLHVQHAFTGRVLEDRLAGPPRSIEFKPTKFFNQFSADTDPVLTIWPGDTIHTTTLDSGGVDEHGITQALYGNPQTGPFYVGGAEPGDVLAVHVRHLRLNRGYADSLDAIAERAKTSALAVKAESLGNSVRWKLDVERGVATPESATGHLAHFAVPLRPMLGCVGVAPDFGFAPFSTGEQGRYGGNMDYNQVVEGSTVYLAVTQPGALLYLGDGHAAMGDGETTEWALETSMDVEFSVDVIPKKRIATPRVETATHLAALGFAGSLDDATRRATAGMVQWLVQDYHLTPSESAQVLGSSAEYVISEIADRDASVVLRLRKEILQSLSREGNSPDK